MLPSSKVTCRQLLGTGLKTRGVAVGVHYSARRHKNTMIVVVIARKGRY